MQNNYTKEQMELLIKIYEDILNHMDEGIVLSDDENRIIFCNDASEAIESIKREKVYMKRMEDVYSPTKNTPNGSMHSAVLRTGIPSSEYFNEYTIKETNTILNVLEKMYPVNIDGKTVAVYSIIKNLPVLKRSIEENLQLKEYFKRDYENGTVYTFKSMIGQNILFLQAVAEAERIALNHNTVLIYGETGTGKELFAQSIHNASAYQDGAFISINCAAIPMNLLEGIFFGSVKGAFTGAGNTAGLFEQAQNGTLFFDEINSMDITLQAKILKAIETKKIRRIGGDKDININCRILCALNEPPEECIKKGTLRQDLYYRLSTSILSIPPLRKRKDDLMILCKYFIMKFNHTYHQNAKNISQELFDIFQRYNWPGNVRELEHIIESIFTAATEKLEDIGVNNLSYYYKKLLMTEKKNHIEAVEEEEKYDLKAMIEDFEREIIRKELLKKANNISATAKALGITRQTLQHKMKKFSL